MTSSTTPSALSVTYISADCGSVIPGKSKAPEAFCTASLIPKLRSAGLGPIKEHHALSSPARYSVTDFETGSVRNSTLNVEVCERVCTTLAFNASATSKYRPPFQLVIGGECCQLPAVLSALAKSPAYADKRIGLIYIDADLDLTSPTDADSMGYFAGMTTTHLLQLPGSLAAMRDYSNCRDGRPVCDAGNMVFFGTNMENPGNRREHLGYLFDNGFKVISSKAVTSGPEAAARAALASMNETDVIFVHLDVDSIDPQLFPLANVPNFTAVGFETMMCALKAIVGSRKVCGLMVAEVNPDHDPKGQMVTRLTDSIVGMLGSRYAALDQ